MFFMWNYYKFHGKEINFKKLSISITLLSLTVVVTTLQFIYPAIIPALDRNKEALLAGELWRLITPLFIQPMGLWQCLFNGIFFLAFVPIAEHVYGRKLILIYFITGIAGQLVNFYWNKGAGGGSSTALYGVIGSLFAYILLNRKAFPTGYVLIPLAGFAGAVVLCFFRDGHAYSVLVGGVMAITFKGQPLIPQSKQTF